MACTRATGMVCPSATRSAGRVCGSGSSAVQSAGNELPYVTVKSAGSTSSSAFQPTGADTGRPGRIRGL
jgi:hypothetical protein